MVGKIKVAKMTQCTIFLILFIIQFWFLNKVFILKRNDGITPMQHLYAQKKNTIDVLFCGPSLMGLGIDIDELWYDYGIAGYNLWGSVQPFWNCYFELKEALKYQSPKVVVLEVSPATYSYEYQDDSRQLCNTQGMSFGKNFLEAIKVSGSKDRYLELLFGIRTFHSRYKELSANDFTHFPWSKESKTDKGCAYPYNHAKMDLTDISDVTDEKKIFPKEEKYLRLFIELCQKKKISILLIKTPSQNRRDEAPYYNYIAKIADEYKIHFLDSNRIEEIGFVEDDSYDGGHINIWGMRKLTSYIGNILSADYHIPDRRINFKYESWNDFHDVVQKQHIANLKDKKGYEAEVLRSNQKPYADLNVPIHFGSDNYNAPIYVRCGLSERENDFSWTDGRFMRMVCNFPKKSMGKELKVKYNLEGVFNNKQKVVAYVNNKCVFDSIVLNGEDLEFSFVLPEDSIIAHIMLEFSEAVSPKRLGLSENDQKLALAIKNIIFTQQ